VGIAPHQEYISMKLFQVREISKSYSERVSDINQKLALAGVAIIWLFREITNEGFTITVIASISLLLFVLSLFIDLMQFLFLTVKWSFFYSNKYSDLKENSSLDISKIEDTEVEQPWGSNYFGWVLFYLKLLFMVLAYIILAREVFCYIITKSI